MTSCDNVWPAVTRYDQLWPGCFTFTQVKEKHQMSLWPGVTICDQVWPGDFMLTQVKQKHLMSLWPGVTAVTRCDLLWPGFRISIVYRLVLTVEHLGVCDQVWQAETSCDQQWPAVTRLFHICPSEPRCVCDLVWPECDQLWPGCFTFTHVKQKHLISLWPVVTSCDQL